MVTIMPDWNIISGISLMFSAEGQLVFTVGQNILN